MRISDWSSDVCSSDLQCTKCGYDGCRPYARAIALDNAAINRCPPGGQQGIQALAQLLQRPELPLDTSCGEHRPLQVAVIDEAHCIGCTLCIQACPVDAIVGANKLMHTVLTEDCTGRSEEHTSELQSLMRISYAVFCLKK